VPATFTTEDEFCLGIWVCNQRQNKDSLSDERRSLLESLNGWSWDPFTDRWAEGFEHLKTYGNTNGSARVPDGFKTKDGFRLGTWVTNQRNKKDSISAERRKLLESLCKDWTWNALTDRWSERFEHLKQYVKQNGSAKVPTMFKTKDGFRLGTWVSTQRGTKDSLSAERRKLLESLKGWVWDARS